MLNENNVVGVTNNNTKIVIFATVVFIIIASISIYSFLKNNSPLITTSKISLPTKSAQPVSIETHQVHGVVEKISGQKITLKDVKKSMNTTSSTTNQEVRMVVIVNQLTVIERISYKDGATITKESADFHKNIQEIQSANPPVPPRPPEPFRLEKITLGDIHIGDVLTASSVEDISELVTFTATKIEIRK